MMKSGLYISALMSLAIGSEISAEEVARVYSPDSMVAVTVGLAEGGVPTYEVKYGEDEFIAESSLGLKTTIGDFTKGLKSAGKPSLKKITDSYSLRNIKKSYVEYEANEMTCTFSNADGAKVMDVVFRVSDNDIAFRYKIYSNWGRLSCLVESETTAYSFPEGTTTFLCPQMKAQSGFARTAPSYETDYTLDDAVGEAFDKTAQLLGMCYPGGPAVSALAEKGVSGAIDLPRPMLHSPNLDMSFSGLKTAVLTAVKNAENPNDETFRANLARAFVDSVVDVLAAKAVKAMKQQKMKTLVVAGGVSANKQLRNRLVYEMCKRGMQVFFPPIKLCTDNGAMIATAGLERMRHMSEDDINKHFKNLKFGVKPRWRLKEAAADIIS